MPEVTRFAALVIEDNYADVRLIQALFEEAGIGEVTFQRAESLEEGVRRLGKGEFDITIVDLNLPDSVGLDTLKRVLDVSREMPTIVLTGLKDEELGSQAIRMGAQDYIEKGRMDATAFYRTMNHAVERARILNQLRTREGQIRESEQAIKLVTARIERIREEERSHIAREVHDELGQILTGVRLQLSMLYEDCPDPTQHQRIDKIISYTDQAIGSVRKIATELRPSVLDDLGFSEAVRWQANEFSRLTGTECGLESRIGSTRIPEDVAIASFRTCQELLTNVARYANAKRVDIELSADDAYMLLIISDDGVGFDTAHILVTDSLGLLGIRERAEHLGGSFEIESTVSIGTTARLRLPLRELSEPKDD